MITERLAGFVAGTSAGDVPDAAIEAARDALIDTLGVAIAGSREPVVDIAAAWAEELGARPQATVWGRGLATHAGEAAFVNGVISHALDFDDTHLSARGHMSAALVPAAIAAGEALGAPGRDVLAAYAIGLEVAAVVGRLFGAGHLERGYHPTPTVGGFGATAVAAHLAGLDADAVARAFGLTASQTGGLNRNFGTMAKPVHAGFAARIGLFSAGMAKKGLTTDPAIFDGKRSALDTFTAGDGEPAEAVFARLGAEWETVTPGNYVKRWPCCYSGHRTLGVMYDLIEKKDLSADDVEEVAIGFLPGAQTALLYRDPKTGLEGKFSVEYMVAAALLDGPLRMGTFTDEMVQRHEARRQMAKVRRYDIPDNNIYSGIGGYNEIVVKTRKGEFSIRESRVPGSKAWPTPAAERDAKFDDCVMPVLGEKRSIEILDAARNCAALGDIRELTATLAAG